MPPSSNRFRTASAQAADLMTKAERQFPVWLLGQECPATQWMLVQKALDPGQNAPDFTMPAAGLALWAWQQSPLDKRLTGVLDVLGEHFPLPGSCRDMVALLETGTAIPRDMAQWVELVRDGADAADTAEFLLPRVAGPDTGPTWLGLGLDRLVGLGAADEAETLVRQTNYASLGRHGDSLKARLAAQAALFLSPPDKAEEAVAGLEDETWGLWRDLALAGLAADRGDHSRAVALLAGLWAKAPWHLNLALVLWEKLHGRAPAPELAETQDAAICIYTWNKADDLGRTLDSLAESDLGRASVTVLDNGSTDGTEDVAEKNRGRFAPDRFHFLRLPVNVGAPAARNWLLTLPQVRRADHAIFLDDDVDLPPDWLAHLLAEAHERPEASSVGCRVVDHVPPHAVQSADYNLMPRELVAQNFRDLEEKVSVNNFGGAPDYGLFAYSRACASVTGCCHLIPRRSLESHGGFDVRFTPTQFDDLARDLGAVRDGDMAAYRGTLCVRHRQHSSLRQAATDRQAAMVMGNKIKLEHLFDKDEVDRMAARQWRTLAGEAAAKAASLGRILSDTIPK